MPSAKTCSDGKELSNICPYNAIILMVSVSLIFGQVELYKYSNLISYLIE